MPPGLILHNPYVYWTVKGSIILNFRIFSFFFSFFSKLRLPHVPWFDITQVICLFWATRPDFRDVWHRRLSTFPGRLKLPSMTDTHLQLHLRKVNKWRWIILTNYKTRSAEAKNRPQDPQIQSLMLYWLSQWGTPLPPPHLIGILIVISSAVYVNFFWCTLDKTLYRGPWRFSWGDIMNFWAFPLGFNNVSFFFICQIW